MQNRFLNSLNVSQSKLARDLNLSTRTINEICQGKRSVTVDTAMRLAHYWPVSAEFWLGLQLQYNLEKYRDQQIDLNQLIRLYQEQIEQRTV